MRRKFWDSWHKGIFGLLDLFGEIDNAMPCPFIVRIYNDDRISARNCNRKEKKKRRVFPFGYIIHFLGDAGYLTPLSRACHMKSHGKSLLTKGDHMDIDSI